jgi:hypothetical protein
MRMLYRVADRNEQVQPLFGRELVLIAILGQRNPRHMLHREIRPATLGHPRLEDLGHVRMREHRQGLSFGLEACHHLLGVHPQLDHFQGNDSAHRLALLGLVDDAHAPFADLFQDAERTNLLGMFMSGAGLDQVFRRRRRRNGLLR